MMPTYHYSHRDPENSGNTIECCNYCEGKGYIEIRDCSGDIQRTETCLWCSGTGIYNEAEAD